MALIGSYLKNARANKDGSAINFYNYTEQGIRAEANTVRSRFSPETRAYIKTLETILGTMKNLAWKCDDGAEEFSKDDQEIKNRAEQNFKRVLAEKPRKFSQTAQTYTDSLEALYINANTSLRSCIQENHQPSSGSGRDGQRRGVN